MRIFKRMRLLDKYKVELSKEPDKERKYVLFHETKTLRGYNYQRIFKGSFKECHTEKRRLEKLKLKDVYR